MDMALVVAAPAQPKAVSSPNATESSNAVSNGNSDFQKTLNGSLKGQSVSESAATKKEASVSAAPVAETPSTGGGSVTELSLEQLMNIIAGLLEDLQNQDFSNEPDQGDMQQQLQELLDQINAMLALLGSQQPQPMPVTPGHVVEDLKADVQQALVQLQAVIGNRLSSPKQGISLDVVSSQIKSIQQKVEQFKLSGVKTDAEFELPNDLDKEQAVPSVNRTQLADGVQQNVPIAGRASAMLDRLNQQAVSPQLLQVITAQQSNGETEASVGASEDGSLTMDVNVNVNTLTQEMSRSTSTVRVVPVAIPVPAQQFADTMANLMVNRFEVKTVGGMSEAKLTLTPEHLGQVDIRISVVNGQLNAMFVTESSVAKDILDNQLAQLRANLQSQGLNVDKLEVAQQTVNSQMSQQQHNGSDWQQEQGNGRIGEDAESEEAAFEAELTQQAVIRGLGYGRAINVRA